MKLCIVTPAPPRSRKGNRVTATRWASIARELGNRVELAVAYERQACDALLAMHARRSHRSIKRFHDRCPHAPLVVALTGTDLYHDLVRSEPARRSLQMATRIIVLQRDAVNHLPRELREKTRVIYQSAVAPAGSCDPLRNVFEVTVIGHLRTVKDPFRAAMAARGLPVESKIHVVQLGEALSESMARRAQAEQQRSDRYVWLGDRPRGETMRRLARGRLLVISSKLEGGANVLCEAIAAGVPVLASDISGNLGILGASYPGYFPVGDTGALRELMIRAETDERFYQRLKTHCRRLAPLVTPEREKRALGKLLKEIAP